MARTLFILNDPPYGGERSYNALRLAVALAKRESEEVKVLHLSDAASSAKAHQKVPQGYYSVERMIHGLAAHGGRDRQRVARKRVPRAPSPRLPASATRTSARSCGRARRCSISEVERGSTPSSPPGRSVPREKVIGVVPGFRFRKASTQNSAEAYGVNAVMMTAVKPAAA